MNFKRFVRSRFNTLLQYWYKNRIENWNGASWASHSISISILKLIKTKSKQILSTQTRFSFLEIGSPQRILQANIAWRTWVCNNCSLTLQANGLGLIFCVWIHRNTMSIDNHERFIRSPRFECTFKQWIHFSTLALICYCLPKLQKTFCMKKVKCL